MGHLLSETKAFAAISERCRLICATPVAILPRPSYSCGGLSPPPLSLRIASPSRQRGNQELCGPSLLRLSVCERTRQVQAPTLSPPPCVCALPCGLWWEGSLGCPEKLFSLPPAPGILKGVVSLPAWHRHCWRLASLHCVALASRGRLSSQLSRQALVKAPPPVRAQRFSTRGPSCMPCEQSVRGDDGDTEPSAGSRLDRLVGVALRPGVGWGNADS